MALPNGDVCFLISRKFSADKASKRIKKAVAGERLSVLKKLLLEKTLTEGLTVKTRKTLLSNCLDMLW